MSEFVFKITQEDDAEKCLELLDDEVETHRWTYRIVCRAVEKAMDSGVCCLPGFVYLNPVTFNFFVKEARRMHSSLGQYMGGSVVVVLFGKELYVQAVERVSKDEVIISPAEGERINVQGF